MISLEDLGERDKWICHLCGLPVRRTGKRNRMWSATRDHVVPKAQGGTNSAENLRLAHRKCNEKRGCLDISRFRKKVRPQDDWLEEMKRRQEQRRIIFNRIRGAA